LDELCEGICVLEADCVLVPVCDRIDDGVCVVEIVAELLADNDFDRVADVDPVRLCDGLCDGVLDGVFDGVPVVVPDFVTVPVHEGV
jgi:hypothetical protein